MNICFADKPKDVNAFLEPFVIELNEVLQNGLTINRSTIKFKLRCFICDTPARSMLRGNLTGSLLSKPNITF